MELRGQASLSWGGREGGCWGDLWASPDEQAPDAEGRHQAAPGVLGSGPGRVGPIAGSCVSGAEDLAAGLGFVVRTTGNYLKTPV